MTGLHKVHISTHFVLINQLESSFSLTKVELIYTSIKTKRHGESSKSLWQKQGVRDQAVN